MPWPTAEPSVDAPAPPHNHHPQTVHVLRLGGNEPLPPRLAGLLRANGSQSTAPVSGRPAGCDAGVAAGWGLRPGMGDSMKATRESLRSLWHGPCLPLCLVYIGSAAGVAA